MKHVLSLVLLWASLVCIAAIIKGWPGLSIIQAGSSMFGVMILVALAKMAGKR